MLRSAKWEYGTLGWYATEILLWCAVILFVVWFWQRSRMVMSRAFRLTPDRIFVAACLAWLLYVLASTLWSVDAALALQAATRLLAAALFFFMIVLGPLSVRRMAALFIASALGQAVFGIYQFLSQSVATSPLLGLAAHPAWQGGAAVIEAGGERWLRAYGAFSHPNVFGGFLVAGIIVTALLWPSTASRRVRLSALAIESAALFFTFSRSAWLALLMSGVGLAIYAFTTRARPHLATLLVLAASFAVGFGLFPSLIATRLSVASPLEVRSVAERLGGFGDALELASLHPWHGVGIGNYTAALRTMVPGYPGYAYQPIHHVPLLFFIELGWFGVGLFGLALVSFAVFMSGQPSQRVVVLRLLPFLIPYLVLALFDHYVFSSFTGLLLTAFSFGLAVRLVPTLSPSHPPAVHTGATLCEKELVSSG